MKIYELLTENADFWINRTIRLGEKSMIHLNEEVIKQAALKDLRTGKVYGTGSHHDAGALPGDLDDYDFDQLESGYLTDTGRYLNREQAARALAVDTEEVRKYGLQSYNISTLSTDKIRSGMKKIGYAQDVVSPNLVADV